MTIFLLDPTGDVAKAQPEQGNKLDTLEGKKVGYIFNQHATCLAFWKTLEQEVETRLHPSATHRIYKENTWAPAARKEVERLVADTDYILVGVGA